MNALELQARQLWRGWAEWRGFTRCDVCWRMRYYGRARCRGWRLCPECFEHASEGLKEMRRLRR